MLIEVNGEQIEIAKAALAFDKTSGRSQGWLGYALARLTWINGRFREQFNGETKYRYTFEEEFDARESAAKIWAELKEKG